MPLTFRAALISLENLDAEAALFGQLGPDQLDRDEPPAR